MTTLFTKGPTRPAAVRRFVVPTSAPHLGGTLAQIQPALSALTGLHTLYLIMVRRFQGWGAGTGGPP